MYLKDKNLNLIKNIITSYELSYESICEKNISEHTLLSILKKQDNGWVRFYFKEYQKSYLPDIDDTVLYYIALLKINYEKYKPFALKIISDCLVIKNSNGLIPTWPQRDINKKEQNDFVVNLHFIWLCHILNIKENSIENLILKWLDYEDITTHYYHNEIFILFSCLKAYEDLNESKFKIDFIQKVNKRIKDKSLIIPHNFKGLVFNEGVFRHIGKDVFFHFFNIETNIKKDLDIEIKDIDNYYQLKEKMYNPQIKSQDNFKEIEKYDFLNSDFYKMGCLRLENGNVVKEDIALFDTTIYSDESIKKTNRFVKNSLSIRPHLNRAMGVLPENLEKILRKYWEHSYTYVKNTNKNIVNSFMMIQLNNIKIPKHIHKNINSIMTFVLVLGDDVVDTDFIIEEEILKFPQSKFFMIDFAGYPKSHEVIKRDKNNYIYFVFDLNQAAPVKNKIIQLEFLK